MAWTTSSQKRVLASVSAASQSFQNLSAAESIKRGNKWFGKARRCKPFGVQISSGTSICCFGLLGSLKDREQNEDVWTFFSFFSFSQKKTLGSLQQKVNGLLLGLWKGIFECS